MSTLQIAPSHARNQSMECFKIVAAILVVFMHVPFPGKMQGYLIAFANFAVPLFFAISGYFNYGADSKTIARRLKHLLRLYLVVIVTSVLVGVFMTEVTGGSTVVFLKRFIPDGREIMHWLVYQNDPRNGQLWYLTSACLCYVILWVYVRYFGEDAVNYRALYFAAFSLFGVYYALGCLSFPEGLDIPYMICRNGFYCGFPMFTLGIFLREHQERIINNYELTNRRLLLLIFAGGAFTLLQYHFLGMGLMTLGTVLEVTALLLLLAGHPVVTKRSGFLCACVTRFGAWSTYIYILHVLVLQIYDGIFQKAVATAFSEQLEAWLRPFLVAGLSFAAAVLFELGERLIRRLRRHS